MTEETISLQQYRQKFETLKDIEQHKNGLINVRICTKWYPRSTYSQPCSGTYK